MVDFSLRKARNNWKQLSSPAKTKSVSQSPTKFKSNPYSDLKVPSGYSHLPTIDVNERKKVATSMQRRLSVHNPKYVPPKLDYSAPLPSMDIAPQAISSEDRGLLQPAELPKRKKNAIYAVNSLREVLSDPLFQAKQFVNETLSDASAVEIDQFTSSLNDLSLEVNDEIKQNINKSYQEILLVNKELGSATSELRQLRGSINELKEATKQFKVMAEKRLQLENNERRKSLPSTAASSSGLLPPAKTSSTVKKDRTSVFMLERMWANELNTLFKSVEGAQKLMAPTPGRHILMESSDWYEINAATLKLMQNVHMFILNDMVLVAVKSQTKQSGLSSNNLSNELVVSQCAPLRDVTVTPQSDLRLAFNFGNRNHCLYQARKSDGYEKLLDVVRKAKDDLRDIFQAEEENAKKIKDSFTYLQNTQQTPIKDSTASPIKGHGRKTSLGNALSTPSAISRNDQYLLQNITMSMHSRSISRDVSRIPNQLKQLDDQIEELDIQISRLNFQGGIVRIKHVEEALTKLADKVDSEEVMLHDLLLLKVGQRRQIIADKLSHILTTEHYDMCKLNECIKSMISLDLPEAALELFLTNRSNYIQDLILQINAFENSTNYITQIAIIRFQTLKKVVLNFQELFQGLERKLSSTLVSWCSDEVSKHFTKMQKQLLSEESLSPTSIKSTRKQVDELKSVGLDFVYKLDEFIKKNSEKIR